MSEPVKKRVDESWKEQAEREKQVGEAVGGAAAPRTDTPAAGAPADAEERFEARFDLFVSGLAMEALIATGDMPHPATRKTQPDLKRAKYLIDLLGVFEEKTKSNLTVEEEKLLKDVLYQLRMRYLAKTGSP